jgi:hypothetical protein
LEAQIQNNQEVIEPVEVHNSYTYGLEEVDRRTFLKHLMEINSNDPNVFNDLEKVIITMTRMDSCVILRLMYGNTKGTKKWLHHVCGSPNVNTSGGGLAWAHHRSCCSINSVAFQTHYQNLKRLYPRIMSEYEHMVDLKYERLREQSSVSFNDHALPDSLKFKIINNEVHCYDSLTGS